MAMRMNLLLVAAILAFASTGAASTTPPYGTDGDTVGGWGYADSNGTTTAAIYSCAGVTVPNGWCGPGMRSFDEPFAKASVDQQLGMLSASAWANSPPNSGFRLRNVGATAEGSWWDTVTLGSSTLPAGTTVDILFRLDLDATTVVPSLSAPAVLRARFDMDGILTATSSGTSSISSIQHFVLDGSDLVFGVQGKIFASSQTAFDTVDYGEATGVAHYYLDVLTPGATLQSASGHDYSFAATSVPEPETYAMMLAGLGLLGFAARRWKQKAA
jgi:hypothetical protein